ncbi:MAG: EAL domain-containing protein [Immundisolibacter sp.]|uniref:EAL domain-containing protein n=1 Tax=Immundisolibacter sp. TaxID=1934948 RepID=UPI003EE08B25
MRIRGQLLLLTALALSSLGFAHAEVLVLGVLAERPKPAIEAQYQPLADYLTEHLSGIQVDLVVLDQDEMEHALRASRLDLALVGPSFYVTLRSRSSLSGALATLMSLHDGQATTSLGGVIVTAAARGGINTVADLKGKRIAIPGKQFLGGYPSQAYELERAGIHMPSGVALQVLGSYDAVVSAVLEGRADAGFVRTGTVETLTDAGKLDPASLRILNLQNLAGYPFAASTRLYPEWPIVALPHVDERTVRRVASALFAMPPVPATGFGGFAPPMDYLAVENLARALRIPPYDQMPGFTWRDAWKKFQIAGIILAVGLVCIGIQLALLARRNRLLAHAGTALEQSMAAQKAILSAIPHPMLELDATGRILNVWASSWDAFSVSRDQLLGQPVSEVLPEQAVGQVYLALSEAATKGRAYGQQIQTEKNLWFELSVSRVEDSTPQRFIVLASNITERRRGEEQLGIAASVFTHASEGIVIADATGHIVNVNAAYSRITGYTRAELVGRSAHEFETKDQGAGFTVAIWRDLVDIGQWQGEVRNRRKSGEFYPAILNINSVLDATGEPTHYVAVLTDISVLKEQQRKLEDIAYHDALTGLPNRALLADRLQQAMAQAERRADRLAVLYLDLDAFKAVNDTYGHGQGDALLITIARRLKAALREGDTLARMGGDEFVLVLNDMSREDDYVPLLGRLLAAASDPVSLDDLVLRVSASIGVTFYPQAQEVGPEHLVRQADQALYQAKLAGKNRYEIYDPDMDDVVRHRHESLGEIRRALQAHEFVLHYQPKVNMRTGEVVGAEALIRWQHPVRGLLQPGEFLPLLEDHAASVDLGEWVIGAALAQMQGWQAAGLDIPVSVNVGGGQLQQPDFVDRLRLLLATYPGVRKGSLELEVLETSALEDIEHVSEVMAACREIDVMFAIDDFGTGYSSLLYLKHLPVTRIKIDQSFVRGMLDNADDLAILDGVLGLAAAFGRQVIAEGVETAEQGELLLRLGCQFAQGYGIARPMPAGEFAVWVGNWHPHEAWMSPQAHVSRDEWPLLLADVEHRAWIRGLEACCKGERVEPVPLDVHECRFAQWVSSEGRARYGAYPVFQAMQKLHRDGHTLADELLDLHGQGASAKAAARIAELYSVQDALRGYMGGFLNSIDLAPDDQLVDVA